MNTFEERYGALNSAQKKAVDTIEGPVMVVAGPGTGKTELLGMRVANILKKTDALAQNILCLTYTESGAYAMRERLVGLIGNDAYKVAVHTFHSFGSEIINQNADYFYRGAHFRAADELSSYEVLKAIFEKLPHDSQLSSQMNGDFTYLRDTQNAISDLKKSGLTSDELLEILARNDAFIDWLQPELEKVFGDRISKKTLETARALATSIDMYSEETLELITYEPLCTLVQKSLSFAVENAEAESSTKPLSAWKREWCEKDENSALTLKDAKRTKRLRAVVGVYYSYLLAMQENSLYDFDDMILRVVHGLEVFDDLRLNLQEQYQYILVDEFQDTNDAQMRLLWNLTNNVASEGRPNIMVVGDDDQAIYRFQGANLSNILDYESLYRDVSVVTLRDNYRSSSQILELSRRVITQAVERLENTSDTINKELTAHHKPRTSQLRFENYPEENAEYAAVASRIASDIASNPSASRAVIARNHRQLVAMLPYLHAQGIPLSYNRRDNVLDSPPVLFLEQIVRVVTLLAEQRLEDADALLPELLAHPAWGIAPEKLWQLSIDSYRERQSWFETMLTREDKLTDIAQWLVGASHKSLIEPLEYVIDYLSGNPEEQAPNTTHDEAEPEETDSSEERFVSPLRDYFFPHSLLEKHPEQYISYLSALSTIRRGLREYRPDRRLMLLDFITFVDKYRELGLPLQGKSHISSEQTPVELLSAHRSKGLEFDAVYVVSLTDSVWGESTRTRSKLISYPHNLRIGISGDTTDEHIRLLFVSLTRAKNELILTAHKQTIAGKDVLPVAYLSEETVHEVDAEPASIAAALSEWHAPLVTLSGTTMKELLSTTLETYKLSATHLGNYLDVSRGGPELFLLQNLLRFPQAMSPSAAFGSAVHTTLQRAHGHFSALGKKKPVEDLLGDFETTLAEHQLPHDLHEHFAKRGIDVLSVFFAARYDSFSASQRVEQSFSSEGVTIDGARLTGAIDLMDIDEKSKTITVTDYKTGKSVSSWQGKTDYEKIKLHHYRQQLMFYKLLIENSRKYAGYTVSKGVIEFVEPDNRGVINRIEIDYDAHELAEFTRLIKNVWGRIQSLSFELEKDYDPSVKGILQFEADILEK